MSVEMSIRRSKAFGSTPETWLGMQMAYDLWLDRECAGRNSSMDAPVDASFSSNGSVHVVRCCRLSGLLVRQLSWPLACM